MAPVEKRLTISEAGSTSEMSIGLRLLLNFIRPRRVMSRFDVSLMWREYFLNIW